MAKEPNQKGRTRDETAPELADLSLIHISEPTRLR